MEKNVENDSNAIVVRDTREAMGAIAKGMRERVKIPVVCVTGTNGKTSVKEILAQILSSRFKVLKSKKSYNNVIGLSLTLFDLDLSHEVAVLEVGTNHPGEIKYLSQIAKPTIAIITNIGRGHLKHLQDKRGVFQEKISILESLPEDGAAILNKDDVFLKNTSSITKNVDFFGTTEGSDYKIDDIRETGGSITFMLGEEEYWAPYSGTHNANNTAAAIVACKHLGMDYDQIKSALKKVTLSSMRLEIVETGGITFINDAYNANPDSFECALNVLKNVDQKGQRGVVAGEMKELGADRDNLHRELGENIASKGIDVLIVLGDHAKLIAEGARESGMSEKNIYFAESHEEAAEKIRDIFKPNDVILIKGSRLSKMEEIIKCYINYSTS